MLADSQIKWVPLKLNTIPLIDKQIKYFYEQYMKTRVFILSGDILAVGIFNQITQQAEQRIKQIDSFYAKYAMDPRTKYIYAAKSLLAKIVDNKNQFQNINDQCMDDQQNNTFIQTKNSLFSHQNRLIESKTQKVSQKSNNFNNSLPNNHYTFKNQKDQKIQWKLQNNASKDNRQLLLSDLKNKQEKSKSPIKIGAKQASKDIAKGSSRKIEPFVKKTATNRKIPEVLQLQKQKQATKSRLEQGPQEIKKSFKDLSELIFTIKMTKQEYNEFIRLKRKNNHA